MLQWMAVDGSNSNRSSPFMVDLVDVLIETRMMEEPKRYIVVIDRGEEGLEVKAVALDTRCKETVYGSN